MQSSASAVEVISHHGTTPEKISKQELKAIYLGQQTQWPNGLAVKLFTLSNHNADHQEFILNILQIYPYQFNRRWQKLVFSGFAVKPTEVHNIQLMLKAIAKTPGSIGYVNEKIPMQGVSYVKLY